MSNTIILKLHNGDPGPQCTDHLVGGDGMPQEWSVGETAIFTVPKTEPVGLPTAHRVSVFVGGKPMGLIGQKYLLASGDELTITDIEATVTGPF